MNEQIVALSVDKIQTFLTEVIHSHVQEKQTEDATLRGITNSSDQISNGFFNTVHEEFNTSIQKMLLECSGVYIFRCTLSESEIEERLNNLFVKYYKESQGQKLIRGVYFPVSKEADSIVDIIEAKKRLKQTCYWNEIIEKNKELLFSFNPAQTIDNTKKDVDEKQKEFKAFAKDINALYKKSNEEQEDKKRFRIAVLKADLDGMGAMFKNIKEYETYKNISQILNKEISLSGLNEAAVQCAPEKKEGWLFPLYIAGDDIFFAVAIEDLICGVNVCKFIMQTVNDEIKKSSDAYSLKLSIGIEITYNRQPIRYYMEMVEAQLKNAKAAAVPPVLKELLISKLSIGDLTFFDINYQQMKKIKEEQNAKDKSALNQQLQNVPIWSYFLSDVKILNYIRNSKEKSSELLGKSNFFYTLLEDITSEEIQSDNRKYMNHILYRLLPNYFESISPIVNKKEQTITLREMELLLNSNIIKQLYTKNIMNRKRGKPVYSTSIDLNNDTTKQRFETYLRLMILFNDDRFQITTKEELRNLHKRYEANEKDIQRCLFSIPREYLYKQSLIEGSKQLTNIFVDVVKSKEKDNHKAGYQRLSLESNSFFRLREIDSTNIQKAESIIELHNPLTKKEIDELNDNREGAGKLPNRLYFDKEKFRDAVSTSNAWNPDFVDSLMLFYQYNELVMKSKKTKDNGGHK